VDGTERVVASGTDEGHEALVRELLEKCGGHARRFVAPRALRASSG